MLNNCSVVDCEQAGVSPSMCFASVQERIDESIALAENSCSSRDVRSELACCICEEWDRRYLGPCLGAYLDGLND